MDVRVLESAYFQGARQVPQKPSNSRAIPARNAIPSEDAVDIELRPRSGGGNSGNSYGVSQYVRLLRKLFDDTPDVVVSEFFDDGFSVLNQLRKREAPSLPGERAEPSVAPESVPAVTQSKEATKAPGESAKTEEVSRDVGYGAEPRPERVSLTVA